jgi:hypothetical protein
MRSRQTVLPAGALLALLASCLQGAPDSVVSGVAVATQQQPAANFASYATFSVDPTVAVVDQTGSTGSSYSVDGSQLAPTIASNMQSRGYTQVPWIGNATPADLQIKMEATLGSQSTYAYAPGYCGWYPYYYCYPGWTYTGSYNFGTLVLTMGDAKNATPGGKLPLLWTAAMYGILSSYYTPGAPSGGTNVNFAKIQGAINQAFADSPYIQR